MTDSIGTCWKNILLGWAYKSECLNVSVDDIEQSDVGTFYNNFRQTISATNISQDDVISFLKTFYPDFEIHLTDDGSISPTEHMYIYSLLLHFSCVRFQDSYFQEVCQSLPPEHQQQIATFLSFIVSQLPIDKENLRRAIANACPKLVPPFLPLESPIRTPKVNKSPPTPHTILVSEMSKEISFLKAQLDAEKDEKSCLEQQLKENENAVRKLASEHKKYVSEISKLKNELLCKSIDENSNNYGRNEQILKKLKKEISEKDEDILNFKESVVMLKDEVKFFKEKCAKTESDISSYMDKIDEQSVLIQNLNKILEEKDSSMKKLSETVNELEMFIHESRSSPNSRFDLNASSDSLDLSISRTTNSSSSFSSPENMGSAVVDVQLKEKEIECAELIKELEKIKSDNAKLAAHVTEQMRQYSNTLNTSDIDILSIQDDDITQSLFVFRNFVDKLVKEYKILVDNIEKQNVEILEVKKLNNSYRCRIDELEALRSNNEETIKSQLKDIFTLNQTVMEKSHQINLLKDVQAKELSELQSQKDEIEVQKEKTTESLARLDNEHKKTKEKLLEVECLNSKLNQNLEIQRCDLAKLEKEVSHYQETVGELEQRSIILSDDKNKLEKDLNEAHAENSSNVELVENLSREISELKESDEKHRHRIAQLEDIVHSNEEMIKNQSIDISSLNKEVESKNQEIDLMKIAHKQVISELQKQLEETESRRKTLYDDNECISKELTLEKEKLLYFNNLNSELNLNLKSLVEKLNKCETDIKCYLETISALHKEQSILTEERNELETNLKHATAANRTNAEIIEKKTQEISELIHQDQSHRSRIADLEKILRESEETVKKQKQEITSLTERVHEIDLNLSQKVKSLESDLGKCETNIANQKERIVELEQQKCILTEEMNNFEKNLNETLLKNVHICSELSTKNMQFETALKEHKTKIDDLNRVSEELKINLEVKESLLEEVRKDLNDKIEENSDLIAKCDFLKSQESSSIATIKRLEESVKDKLSANEKLAKMFELYKAEAERKLDQFQDTTENLEKTLQQKSTLVQKLEMESRTLQGKVTYLSKSLDDSQISFDQVNNKLAIKDSEIAECSIKLKVANDCRSQLEADKRVLQIENSNLKKAISQLEENSEDLESKRLHFQVNFEELSKKHSESECKVVFLTESKKAVSDELNNLRAKFEKDTASFEEQLKTATHECESQRATITNYEKTVSKLTDQIEELTKTKECVVKEKSILNQELIDLKNDLQEQIRMIYLENEGLKAEIKILTNKLSNSEDKYKCLEMTASEKEKLHLDAKELVTSLDKQLLETHNALLNLEFKLKHSNESSQTEIQSIKAKLSEALITTDKQNSEIETLQNEILAKDSKIEEISGDKKNACDENEDLRQKIVELSRDLVNLEREKQLLSQNLDTSYNEIAALKLNLKTFEDKCERLEMDNQKLEQLEAEKSVLNKRVQELEVKLTYERSELARSAAESVSLKENQLKEMRHINSQLQKCNAELSDRCSALEQEKEKSQIGLDELRVQLSSLQTEKDSLVKQNKEISDLHTVCSKTTTELESDLRAKAELCKSWEERYQKCRRDIQDLQKTKEGLTKRLETQSVKLGQSQGDLAKTQKENAELKKEHTNKENEAKKVLVNLKKENAKLQNELKALKESNLLSKDNDIEKIESEKEKSELQNQLQAIKQSDCQIKAKMKSIEDQNHELAAMNQALVAFVHDVEKELLMDGMKVEAETIDNVCISDKCKSIFTQLSEIKKQKLILVQEHNSLMSKVNDLNEQNLNILDKMSKLSIKLEMVQGENDNLILDVAKLKTSNESAVTELSVLKNRETSKIELESNVSKDMSTDCMAQLEEYKSLYETEKQLVEKLQQECAILQAKLYKNRAITQEKEKQWSEEKAGLLMDNQRAEERIKDNRLELEGKLEKMKARMRILHKEEVEKIKRKCDHEFGTIKSKYESEFVALKNEIAGLISKKEKFEEHIQKLSKQLFHSNERILELQKENKFMEARLNENNKSVPPLWDFPPMNENERDDLQSTFLADFNPGRVSFHGRESVCATELQYRNSLAAPHLRSTYAMQYADQQLREDDIKDNILNNLDDSLTSLIHNGQRKKVGGTTSYKKPGPPTPSKNGGRLSLGANELPLKDILKDCNDTSSVHSEKRGSPGKKRTALFSLSKTKDENVPPTAARRLSGFFKRNK